MKKYLCYLVMGLMSVSYGWAEDAEVVEEVESEEIEETENSAEEESAEQVEENAAEEVKNENAAADEYGNMEVVGSDFVEDEGAADKEEKIAIEESEKNEKREKEKRSQSGFNYGIDFSVNYSAITGGTYPLGGRADIGFVAGYFFKNKIAVFTGVYLDVFGYGGKDSDELNVEVPNSYGWSSSQDIWVPVKNQYVVNLSIGMPIYVRYMVTKKIWAQAGILMSGQAGETNYYEIDYERYAGSPILRYSRISSGNDGQDHGFGIKHYMLGAGLTQGSLNFGLNLGYGPGFRACSEAKGCYTASAIDVGFNMYFWLK